MDEAESFEESVDLIILLCPWLNFIKNFILFETGQNELSKNGRISLALSRCLIVMWLHLKTTIKFFYNKLFKEN